MSPIRYASIKRKQTLLMTLTSCVALLLATAGFVSYEVVTFRETMVQNLSNLAKMLGNNCKVALEYDDTRTVTDVLADLRTEPNIVAACLYKDGRVFTNYHRLGAKAKFLPPMLQADGPSFGPDRLVLFQRIAGTTGAVYLESDLQALHQRLRQYANIAAGVLLLAVVVAFLLSAWMQRFISGPILHLVEATRAVARQKNYAVRVPKESQDELGLLIDDFNEMLAQIQMRDTALQEAHAGLEKRVAERTGELQAEVAERQRAEEQLRQQFGRLSLLNQIIRAVAERMDLADIFAVTLRNLEDHLPVDFGGVYLFDASGDALVVAAHGPRSEAWAVRLNEKIGTPLKLDPAALESFLHGQMLNLQNAAHADSDVARRLAAAGLEAAVLVPLIAESKPLGTLLVARQGAHDFSSGECEFLRMVSEQVALVARQAQLHGELRDAYNELRATQHAVLQQERLRALGQMASGIAHDINNALAPIIGFADLMLTGDPTLSATTREHLERIKTAGLDISHTVDRMREFYRQRNEAEHLFRLDLNRLVQDAINLARPRWRDIPQQRGLVVSLRTELDATLPPVLGIESEVRQGLVNLIINAVDAMPQGGTLTLRTRLVERTAKPGLEALPAWVHLEIADTGIGMDDETRRRCLEPFFSTKGKRGTGLGLAMVYGVMERHGGQIELESAVGMGTTVRLIFPVPVLAPEAEAAPSRTGPALPCLRILCIDDEPMILDVVSKMLISRGHKLTTRESGEAGLDIFRKTLGSVTPFDVVITDLGMPGMDGRAVAQAIKRESPATPVILLTGWGMFMKYANDTPKEVDCVLSKPPTVKDLEDGLLAVVKKPPA